MPRRERAQDTTPSGRPLRRGHLYRCCLSDPHPQPPHPSGQPCTAYSHLPAPPISPPPLSPDPQSFLWWRRSPTRPWFPCVAHATPLSTSLPLYARELKSGRGPPPPQLLRVARGAWLAGGFLSCRFSPRWSPGSVGVTGRERPSWRYPTPRNAHAAAAGLRTPSRRSAHVCAGEKAEALRRKAGTHPVPSGAPRVHRLSGQVPGSAPRCRAPRRLPCCAPGYQAVDLSASC